MKNGIKHNRRQPAPQALGKNTFRGPAGTATDVGADHSAESARLKVFLLYEDFATGFRAWRRFVFRIQRLGLQPDFSVNAWKFKLLRPPALREQAAIEAREADIVLVAAHGGGELAPHVKSWFTRWLALKADQPCALVLSLDKKAFKCSGQNRVLAYLQSSAERAGLEVSPNFEAALRSECKAYLRERSETRGNG
jgi:hypothetical protein